MSGNDPGNTKGASPIKETPKREWTTPVVTDAGTIAEILQGGGGKLSTQSTDTADPRKSKGAG